MFTIRPVKNSDKDLLRLATLHNFNWNEEHFTLQDVDEYPEFSHYFKTWEETIDFGFIAENNQEVLGVVWVKFFTADDAGYGFVAEDIPELSVYVFPSGRRLGIATKLIESTIEKAKIDSVPAISLSVESGNFAKSLYLKLGFEVISSDEGAETLILNL